MKRTTIADIADETNLSLATVSRAIHNNGYVSDINRTIIRTAVDKLGYVPNKMARGLRNQRTDLIGHVMGLSANPITARMADAMHSVFEEAGYHVITAMVRDNNRNERSILENLAGFMVEAIIFNTILSCDDDIFRWLVAQGISVVLIERERHIDGIDIISPDNIFGAHMAVQHLVDSGHRNLLYIGVEPEWGTVEKLRYDGFLQAVKKNELPPQEQDEKLVKNYTIENGYAAMSDVFKNSRLPTAIFATSDLLACGVLQCIYDKGLRVPDDISIIGFDNTLADSCVPPFSSIDMRPDQIGMAALEMIQDRKSYKNIGSRYKYIEPFIADRGSVRRITY